MAGIDQSVFNEMGIADHPAMYRILDAVGRILDEPALPAPPGRQEQQARGEARVVRATGEVTPSGWQPGKPTLTPGPDLAGKVWKVWKPDSAF